MTLETFEYDSLVIDTLLLIDLQEVLIDLIIVDCP